MWITRQSVGCFLIGAMALIGCSKKGTPRAEEKYEGPKTITANPGTDVQKAIIARTPVLDRLIGQMELKTIHLCWVGDGVIPPPKNIEDFKDLQQSSPKLYQSVKDGNYVINWSVSRNARESVLAYWKHTPEHGGPVLLVGGAVEFVTPAEFKKLNAPAK